MEINNIQVNKFTREKIDELYPGALMIDAMRVQNLPKSKVNSPEMQKAKVTDSEDYLGFLKKDGYWYELEKTENGDVYLFSRTTSRKTGLLSEKSSHVPHVVQWAKDKLPNGTILTGELAYEDKHKTSKDVNKIMLALAPKALKCVLMGPRNLPSFNKSV